MREGQTVSTSKITKIFLKGVAFAACIIACQTLEAQGLPTPVGSPSFSESVTTYRTDDGSPVTQSSTGPGDVSNGVSTAGTRYNHVDEGTASINIDPTSIQIQQASASVSWSFMVVAPAALTGTLVPVILLGSGNLSVIPATTVNDQTVDLASAEIYAAPNLWGDLHPQLSSPGSREFGITVGGPVAVNQLYTIYESLSAYSIPELFGQKTDHVTVSIDPELSLNINSSFPNYDQFSLVISPDPVPLPPSLWLLLGSLGGMGLMCRSKRPLPALP